MTGCDWCRGGKPLTDVRHGATMTIDAVAEVLDVSEVGAYGEHTVDYMFPVSYCPVCGADLQKVAERSMA